MATAKQKTNSILPHHTEEKWLKGQGKTFHLLLLFPLNLISANKNSLVM
jgi:hypothetical protein